MKREQNYAETEKQTEACVYIPFKCSDRMYDDEVDFGDSVT